MDRLIIEKLKNFGIVYINEPMKNHTTFKTGGPADVLIFPFDAESLQKIIRLSRESSVPLTVIGGGSNLLVSDNGIRGIVVTMNENECVKGKMKICDDGLVYADAIISKKDFVNFCTDNNYEGIEFMAGIPGCIGGGISMNAGTTDGNFIDILHSLTVIDESGSISAKTVSKDMAGYRRMDIGGSTILGAYFRLNKAADINAVKSKVDRIISERKIKHPLDYPSAGSVFKNPHGHSSWKLINDAGLKGMRVGGACVSDLHTNFIINVDNATSGDISSLVDLVKEKVFAKYNVKLETEIKYIGEF